MGAAVSGTTTLLSRLSNIQFSRNVSTTTFLMFVTIYSVSISIFENHQQQQKMNTKM
jgi:hypothetical protein